MSSASRSSAPPTIAEERFLILGTAGHIDHGKTALVRTLTGTDTDRLPEEKRRGMTIELGFAELSIGPLHFGVVDVPGHERFVRTMVAGATGIDVGLLVVAADDSVMPQTVEHVDILSLLNVRNAVVAITKTDLVDDDLAELVAEDVRDLLAQTPLRNAPVIKVSSITGRGIDELNQALVAAADGIPDRTSNLPFRMAIDRVFTVQGRGAVVTGSVLRGQIAVGDALEIWPGGASCKVRDLQSHGRESERLRVGQRAALNLIGADRTALSRGCDLATPGYLRPSRMLDAKFQCLASCRRGIRTSSRLRLCLGTRETLARIVPMNGSAVAPGETAFVQFRSTEPMIASYGQRFIVRDESASRTLGGGVVLRCTARRWLRGRDAERTSLSTLDTGDERARVEEVLRFAGFHPPDELAVSAQAGVELDRLPTIYAALQGANKRTTLDSSQRHYAAAAVHDLLDRAARWLERYHSSRPDVPGCPIDVFTGWLERKSARGLGRPLLDRLIREKQVRIVGQYVCLPAFAPALSAQDEKLLAAMMEELFDAAFQPPALPELRVARQTNVQRLQRLAKIAEATGQLVNVRDDLFLHADRERQLRDVLRQMTESGSGVSVSQIRERLQSSRKYVVPIVEYLDRVGFTRREGDLRWVNEHAST